MKAIFIIIMIIITLMIIVNIITIMIINIMIKISMIIITMIIMIINANKKTFQENNCHIFSIATALKNCQSLTH